MSEFNMRYTANDLTLNLLLHPLVTLPAEQHVRRSIRKLVFGMRIGKSLEDGILHRQLMIEMLSGRQGARAIKGTYLVQVGVEKGDRNNTCD